MFSCRGYFDQYTLIVVGHIKYKGTWTLSARHHPISWFLKGQAIKNHREDHKPYTTPSRLYNQTKKKTLVLYSVGVNNLYQLLNQTRDQSTCLVPYSWLVVFVNLI